MSKKRRSPASASPSPTTGPQSSPGDQTNTAALILAAGLALYGLWFFVQPLDELTRDPADPFQRFYYLLFWFSAAPEVWRDRWFGATRGWFGDRLPILAVAGLILAVAWSAGNLLLRLLSVEKSLSRLERAVFAMAAGLNLVSLGVLLSGLLGLAQHRWLLIGLAIPIVGASAVVAWRERRARSSTPFPAPPLGNDWRLLLAAVPFVLLLILGGLLPASDFDVREYHLQAPKEFFQAGRITFLPHNVYANMPLGSEMHSLLGMILLQDWWTGALVGKTIQVVYVLLTALALFAAGRRWYSARAGVWAAVVYVSTPWILHVATAGLVEGAAACYAFLTLFAWLSWRDVSRSSGQTTSKQATPTSGNAGVTETDAAPPPILSPSTGYVLLTGFLAGSAVATKYPAALFVVLPILGLVVWPADRARWSAAGWFLLAVAIGCGPWLVKNAAFTGNPVYPLLYSVFGGETWTAAKNAQWQGAHQPPNFVFADRAGNQPRDLVESLGEVLVRSPWLNFVTWPLAIAALCVLPRDGRVRLGWGYIAFALAAWWLFTHRIDRFWIPLLPMASLLAGIGATAVTGRAWTAAATTALVIALAYDFAAGATNTGAGSSNRFFVPYAELRDDPERITPWQRWLNAQTPPGKQVLCEGDAQVLDLNMPVSYHTAFDDAPLLAIVDANAAPEELRKALSKYAFVYVNWNEINRYRQPGNYGYTDRIQPETFSKLVRQGVLQPAVEEFLPAGIEIFPVVGE